MSAKALAAVLVGLGLGLLSTAVAGGAGRLALAARGLDATVDAGQYAQFLAGGAVAGAPWAVVGLGVGAVLRAQVRTVVAMTAWVLFVEGILVDNAPDLGRFAPGALGQALAGLHPDSLLASRPRGDAARRLRRRRAGRRLGGHHPPGLRVSPLQGPAYPDDDIGADDGSAPTMGWGGRIALVAATVAVVLIVVLHLTGTVGPGAHLSAVPSPPFARGATMDHRVPHDPLERINAHRLEELDVIARAFGGVADVQGVRAKRVDAEGIDIAVEWRSGGATTARVRFLEPVSDYPSGVRVAFVPLARRARSVLEAGETTGGTRPRPVSHRRP